MPEANQIRYTLKELTVLMLKDQGIESGLWMIQTRFNWAVQNIVSENGPTGPATISVLAEVGIQKADGPSPLSVDAAQLAGGRARRRPAGKQRRSTRRKAQAS